MTHDLKRLYKVGSQAENAAFNPHAAPKQKTRSIASRAILGVCLGGLLFVVLGVLPPQAVFAQTPADINAAERQAELLQRMEQERLLRDQEEALRRTKQVDGMETQSLTPKIVVPDIGAPCRNVSSITISGAPNLPKAVRQHISTDFTGRCLNVGDIERILAEITKVYINRGYITTRAYLPPQDLSKGHLDILVIEGVIEKILIKDNGANSVSIRNVFPGIDGDLLNLRDLEQGINQINRLSSNNAKLDIQPGEKPGRSIVVVHNQPTSRFHFIASVDNQGSHSTGDMQTSITAIADNLLGINDVLYLTHRESTPGDSDRKFSSSDNFNLGIPFGYTTFSVGISRSKYASPITVPSGLVLTTTGSNKADNIRLDHVVYRDQTSRASVAATLTTKKAENFLDGQRLGVSSRKLTILDLDGNFNTGFAGGVLTLDIGYARGLDAMGALNDPDNLPDWASRAQFGKFKAGFSYSRPFRAFNQAFSFSSQFSAQKAENTLYGSEQISIGGLYSVRGFVNNTLSGDDGYYWRNEVSMHLPIAIGQEKITTRLYVGYDVGAVNNRPTNAPEGRLSGMVVGASTKWRGATWDFFVTRPLTLPDTMTKESSQTWFRLAYSL